MFKLKLWTTPLLFLIAGALLVVSGTTYLHERLLPPYERAIQHAKIGLKGQLNIDATRAVNHVADLTDRPAVRAALTGGDASAAATMLLAVPEGMRTPAFGLVADGTGSVVATGGENPMGEAIQGLPEFAEALTGVARDGFGAFGGNAFHLAAAPIIANQKVTGAVVIGWPLDGEYADRLSSIIGLPVMLIADDNKRLGKAFGNLTADEVKIAIAEGTIGAVELDLPVKIPGLPILVPEAKRFQTGTVSTVGPRSPSLVTAVDRTSALQTIALAQLWVAGVALLLAVFMVVIVASVQRSISKPMDVIMDHLSAFAQGSAVGILPEAALKGPFVRLGKQINMILQAPPPGAAPRPGVPPVSPVGAGSLSLSGAGFPSPGGGSGLGADYGAPPPPPDDDELGLAFAGFENSGPLSPPAPTGRPPAMPPAVPPDAGLDDSAPPVGRAPVSDRLSESALSGLFDDGGDDPLAAFRVNGGRPASKPPPPPMTDPPRPASSSLPGAGRGAAHSAPVTSPGHEAYNPDATVMFQVPQELIAESAQLSGTGRPVMGGAPPPMQRPTEDRTVVAQVPSELLSAAAPRPSVSTEEDAHYRDVFQEFLQTRVQCGEDTDQLTYDRFVAKLMKNRQQIIEKYNSKSVRFQVYVKQGKAALRAVPVRD